VDPVPDPLILRKSGSTGNRTRTSGLAARNSWPPDHRGGRKETTHKNLQMLKRCLKASLQIHMNEPQDELHLKKEMRAYIGQTFITKPI
jgi:hypothetical protein